MADASETTHEPLKEHAAMLPEWLRRHDPELDEELSTCLKAPGSIRDAEEHPGERAEAEAGADEVMLFLLESFTFRVLAEEAAVPRVYQSDSDG